MVNGAVVPVACIALCLGRANASLFLLFVYNIVEWNTYIWILVLPAGRVCLSLPSCCKELQCLDLILVVDSVSRPRD
jgi:hypothetical protein